MAGHVRDTTPELASLAASGRSYTSCFSHDIWTRSATASILTGHAPSAHQTWSHSTKLPDGIETIPKAFDENGFRTVGISSNPQLGPATGLDRGFRDFHYFDRSTMIEEPGIISFIRWLGNIRSHSGGLTLDTEKHCTGFFLNEIAKEYIDTTADSGDSLFLYLHHGDSHHAYIPPVTWRRRYAEEMEMSVESAVRLASEMSDNLHEYISRNTSFTDAEWQALNVLYDAAISYVDSLTGSLIRYAKQRLNDPIVVVTGDHGELFGEQGLLAHMLTTHTAVTNVPLVIEGLSDLPGDGLIQHADVMKMLCNELDIEHPVPAGQDPRKEKREVAVCQRSGDRAEKKLDKIRTYNSEFSDEEFPPSDLTSVRTEQWRFERSAGHSQLYRVPEETPVCGDEYTEVVSRLDEQMSEWLHEVGEAIGDVGTAEFDEATRSRLRDLGYIQ